MSGGVNNGQRWAGPTLSHQRGVRPAAIVIYDGYRDGFHYIDIYARVVRYEIKDDKAYEVTAKGRRRVTVRYAQQRVNAWRDREAKVITVLPPSSRQLWLMMIGFAFIAVTSCGALLWLLW